MDALQLELLGRACRLESVQLCMSSPGVDDPLDNEEQLADQMDALPYMCRLQYARTQEYLCGIMDPLISACSERQASGERCMVAGVTTLLMAPFWSSRLAAVVAGRRDIVAGSHCVSRLR